MNAHLLNSRSFIITLGLLTAVAAVTVDLSLPAIPAMVDALDSSLSRGQQIVGIFMAGMAIGQIPAGLASDRFGRIPALYYGMTLFFVSACIAAYATDIDVLLAARFAQGVGGAAAIVISRAIVRDVASGKDAAKLMSLMTMIFTVAPVIAPSIGALLLAYWNWRAPFIVIAIGGAAMLLAIKVNLVETHVPNASEHPLRQLKSSFSEYFSHRQSIFGLLVLILPPAGYMSIIATSSALTIKIYGFSETQFGLIFACAGLSILLGSIVNRRLVSRFETIQLIGLGVFLVFISGAQLLVISWLNEAPFWWIWFCVCLYMFTIPILTSNTTVLALDPLPRVAGVASSILGTSQNIIGALGALVGALIYDGTVRNTTIIIAVSGVATAGIFLLREFIAPGVSVRTDEPAQD